MAIILNSCKRIEDPIFDESASARVQQEVENARAVLRSHTDWWLIKYYPSPTQAFGGYTIFSKFISDSEVTLTSDINSDRITSTYAVIPETGALLTFNGFNKVIHYFSEPGIDSGRGAPDTGLRGDFEFIVIEATPDLITLKGKRTGNTITMEPIRSNPEELIQQIRQSAAYLDLFRNYSIQKPSGEIEPLILNERTFRLSSNANSPLMSYRPTSDGLELYSDYELEGIRFNRLKFVPIDEAFEFGQYVDESGQIKIFPVYSHASWFSANVWYFSYNNLGRIGQANWDIARAKMQAANISLNFIRIGRFQDVDFPFAAVVSLNNDATQGLLAYSFTPVAGSTDQFRLSYIGAYVIRAFTGQQLNAGVTDLVASLNNRTFRITSEERINPSVITFTDIVDANNFFRVSLAPIFNPFQN